MNSTNSPYQYNAYGDKMTNAIWQNENPSCPASYDHEYDEECQCLKCCDTRPVRCDCGAELKSNDIEFCGECL